MNIAFGALPSGNTGRFPWVPEDPTTVFFKTGHISTGSTLELLWDLSQLCRYENLNQPLRFTSWCISNTGKAYADLIKRKSISEPILVDRLKALLLVRNTTKVKGPMANRQVGDELPYSCGLSTKAYCVSDDARWMFEMANRWLGTPGGEEPQVDMSNDYEEDDVYTAGRGICWMIKRGSSRTILGFHFVNTRGSFQFAITDSFWMGAHKLQSYGPGIHKVDPFSGHVKRTKLPSALLKHDFNIWHETTMPASAEP